MAKKALTDITYGGKAHFDAGGTQHVDEQQKTIKAGESIPSGAFSKDELEELRIAGAVGDSDEGPSIALGSTSSQLQAEGSDSLTNLPPTAADAATPPTEDELAEALDKATNQIDRGKNQAKEAKKA